MASSEAYRLSPLTTLFTGIILIILTIILAVVIVNPSPYLYTSYKLLAAIGVACSANSLPGVFHLKMNNSVRLSGSVGLMALVIYLYPVVGSQNTLYTGSVNINSCSDSVSYVYMVTSDYQSLPLHKGDEVQIMDVTGKQDLGPIVGVVGPEGKESGLFGFTLSKYCTVKSLPHGSLIYKFGRENAWRVLSTNETYEVKSNDDKLEVDINDAEKSNNFGFYFIKLKIVNRMH